MNSTSRMSRASGGNCSSGPKRVLVPTFELVSCPEFSVPALTRCMRARKARRNGAIVVWDEGEDPCRHPDIKESVVGGIFQKTERKDGNSYQG